MITPRTADGPDHRTAAAYDVRAMVRRVAVSCFGAASVDELLDNRVDPPATESLSLTRTGLDVPLAGVRAALLVAEVTAGALREWALRARGAGASWDDVASALKLTDADESSDPGRRLDLKGRPPAEAAWSWLIEHRPPRPASAWWSSQPASAVWVCTTCRERVRDSGPFDAHPDDREHGHARDCARHAAALHIWWELNDWDDTSDLTGGWDR